MLRFIRDPSRPPLFRKSNPYSCRQKHPCLQMIICNCHNQSSTSEGGISPCSWPKKINQTPSKQSTPLLKQWPCLHLFSFSYHSTLWGTAYPPSENRPGLSRVAKGELKLSREEGTDWGPRMLQPQYIVYWVFFQLPSCTYCTFILHFFLLSHFLHVFSGSLSCPVFKDQGKN